MNIPFFEIVIIGGGLAGLSAGIHLALAGKEVCIIEKNKYPKHKVCGEYVSNEVKPYLHSLGVDVDNFSVDIKDFRLTSENGKSVACKLPLGGFGISRYSLDHILFQKATELGVMFRFESVKRVEFHDLRFDIENANKTLIQAKFCLGAFGKRSILDRSLKRAFSTQRTPWLAVKAHYHFDHPEEEVALHHFEGGYCGISRVETGLVNACYLVHQSVFERYRDIAKLQQYVLSSNGSLKQLFDTGRLAWDKPLSISQIYFGDREKVVDHVLMIGDAGGMIHPLAGNGMAMAIHSAKLAVEVLIQHDFDVQLRNRIEEQYLATWNRHFKKRIKTGRLIQALFERHKWSNRLMNLIPLFKGFVPLIIKQTHGKQLTAARFQAIN